MTPDQWKQLTPKQQWDVTVALRGPDVSGGDAIKWLTSSVIRGHMEPIMRVGGLINRDLNLVVLPKQQGGYIAQSLWDYNHFSEHIREAASVLDIPIAVVSFPWWFNLVNPHMDVRTAIKSVLGEWERMPNQASTDAIAELKRHLTQISTPGANW